MHVDQGHDHDHHLASALPMDLSLSDIELDLVCPSCGSGLASDDVFLSHRMCGQCRRHFSMPARERLGLLVDAGSFVEFVDSVGGPVPAERVRTLADALVTGVGTIGGNQVACVLLDDHLIGGTIGAVIADRIIRALDAALTRRIPVLLVCAGGTGRAAPGPLSAIQPGRLAAIFTQLHLAGIPAVALLTHPTSATIFSALAAPSDLILAEPGAHVVHGSGPDGQVSADRLVEGGWIDGVVDRVRTRTQVAHFLDLASHHGASLAPAQPSPVATTGPATWSAQVLARHEDRPSGRSYVERLFGTLVELRGDRSVGDDPGTICGLGRLDGMSIAVVAQDRANHAPFPAPAAVAARKIARLARLAGRLELPLVILVDRTQSDDAMFLAPDGNHPVQNSPETSHSVAALAMTLSFLPVPVIAIGIGETAGPVSQALMSGDRQLMQENTVTVSHASSPVVGGTPAIPVGRAVAGDRPSVMTAHEHLRLGLIDAIIAEPMGGAHLDPDGAANELHVALQHALSELAGIGQRRLLDTRLRRQRSLGQSTLAGLDAARSELWELQEWQRSLTRQIDEWRERWDQMRTNQPRLGFQRPDLADLATRLRARRSELLERAGRGGRSSE